MPSQQASATSMCYICVSKASSKPQESQLHAVKLPPGPAARCCAGGPTAGAKAAAAACKQRQWAGAAAAVNCGPLPPRLYEAARQQPPSALPQTLLLLLPARSPLPPAPLAGRQRQLPSWCLQRVIGEGHVWQPCPTACDPNPPRLDMVAFPSSLPKRRLALV